MNRRKLLKILKGSGLEYEIIPDGGSYSHMLYGRRQNGSVLFLAGRENSMNVHELAAAAGMRDIEEKEMPKRWLRLLGKDTVIFIDRNLRDQKTALRISDSESILMKTEDLRNIFRLCGMETAYLLPHQII